MDHRARRRDQGCDCDGHRAWGWGRGSGRSCPNRRRNACGRRSCRGHPGVAVALADVAVVAVAVDVAGAVALWMAVELLLQRGVGC
jgi:hypothetical protein